MMNLLQYYHIPHTIIYCPHAFLSDDFEKSHKTIKFNPLKDTCKPKKAAKKQELQESAENDVSCYIRLAIILWLSCSLQHNDTITSGGRRRLQKTKTILHLLNHIQWE